MALQSITALASITLQEASASVSFTSIPTIYRDLVVEINGGVTSGNVNVAMTLNNDTTDSNYSNVQMSGYGTGVDGGPFTTGQRRFINYYGYMTADLNTIMIVNLLDSNVTDKHKLYLSRANNAGNGVAAVSGRWANTAAITSITFDGGTFRAGTTFDLYGRIG